MSTVAPLDAAGLLRSVGLLADGPAVWGRPIRAPGPGIFVVELPLQPASAPLDINRIGKWLERLPSLRLDGQHPTSKELAARLAAFWIPSTPILYVGTSEQSISARVSAMERTILGDRRPYPGGGWLKTLAMLDRARVWWAGTAATEEYEDALMSAFAAAVPDEERARLHDPTVVLPFANLRSVGGEKKAHGLSGYLVPDDRPAPPEPSGAVRPPGEPRRPSRRRERVRLHRPADGVRCRRGHPAANQCSSRPTGWPDCEKSMPSSRARSGPR